MVNFMCYLEWAQRYPGDWHQRADNSTFQVNRYFQKQLAFESVRRCPSPECVSIIQSTESWNLTKIWR